ncbi:unnamed protein product [Polarella glacialis]|uniref:RING-type E3 ubiquitin transferase n=1 Tax=Polarella glacialis TaxID=89957 RepID=A0A813EZW7_POLGL|nr:unnamed protein product [Polarella glacialis]
MNEVSRVRDMPETGDPVLDLLGWHGEPLLLSRLKWHLLESAFETACIAAGMMLCEQKLTNPGIILRLLSLPLAVTILKLCWACQLMWSYQRMKSADFPTAVRRMGCLNSRGCWSCSVAVFTGLSCLLMVWHGLVFLLLLCNMAEPLQFAEEEAAVVALMCSSALFVVINFCFWRDIIGNYDDMPLVSAGQSRSHFLDLQKLQVIYNMYRSQMIRLVNFGTVKQEDVEDNQVACAICLEDFADRETVAKLQCGHLFHPRCINKWLLEDWRCPFRCSLDASRPACKHQSPWQDAHASLSPGEGTGTDILRPAAETIEGHDRVADHTLQA